MAGGREEMGSIRSCCLASCLLIFAIAVAAHVNLPPQQCRPVRISNKQKHLLANGAVDEALAEVQRGLAQAPRNVEGLNLLAAIYHLQENIKMR